MATAKANRRQRHGHVKYREREPDLPPLLLRSTDVGLPLQPMFIGASEKDAGHGSWGPKASVRALPSPLRSSAGPTGSRGNRHTAATCCAACALKNCKQLRPARLLHEWLAVNDYCDWVQQHFVEIFTAEVLSEWYTRAGTWCQGTANLAMSLLVGGLVANVP